jgi:hypothetical protein
MKANEIKPGDYYLANDIYEKKLIHVRVIEPSKSVADHFKCLRADGTKVILPASAFVRREQT